MINNPNFVLFVSFAVYMVFLISLQRCNMAFIAVKLANTIFSPSAELILNRRRKLRQQLIGVAVFRRDGAHSQIVQDG